MSSLSSSAIWALCAPGACEPAGPSAEVEPPQWRCPLRAQTHCLPHLRIHGLQGLPLSKD